MQRECVGSELVHYSVIFHMLVLGGCAHVICMKIRAIVIY